MPAARALLLTGFGLHDSISDIVYKQFGDIFLYDVSITVKDAAKAESGALADVLADGDAVRTPCWCIRRR